MSRALPGWLLFLVLSALAREAAATGFTDHGQDIIPTDDFRIELHGGIRLRSELLYNLDLDRGPTPSGEVLFPVSLSDPNEQLLTYHDLRLRTDLAAYAPGGMLAVKARLDVLDNLPLGGSVDGIPGGSGTQAPPESALRVKRAWGEVLTPLGLIAGGRMGHHWGLGMLGNSGDCADCDTGDAADRIAFITAMLSHIFAVAYDFSATGYTVPRGDGMRAIDIEPTAAVRTITVAVLNWRSDWTRRRRRMAGKGTMEYGAYYAHRWQDKDIPATYLPLATPSSQTIDASQVMARGLKAHAVDLWGRLTVPYFRMEFELAYLHASLAQASLLPGLELTDPVLSDQLGGALETEIGNPEGRFGGGVDAGYATGDPAPGFGARTALGSLNAPQPGDLNGPQGVPPHDFRVDNFRFHSDYRIDRILWREIIGTVTDAIYVRPHLRVKVLDFGTSRLQASVAAILSWANEASSTPGGEKFLGFEIDPTLAYTHDVGFAAALEHAVLIPGAGLDNPDTGQSAEPAQLLRLRLGFHL